MLFFSGWNKRTSYEKEKRLALHQNFMILQIKLGPPCRFENLSKYHHLIRIEEEFINTNARFMYDNTKYNY
jgi:enolase